MWLTVFVLISFDLDSNRKDGFTNQSFTENKAVIYVKTVQIGCSIYHPTFYISKIHPLLDAAFDAD